MALRAAVGSITWRGYCWNNRKQILCNCMPGRSEGHQGSRAGRGHVFALAESSPWSRWAMRDRVQAVHPATTTSCCQSGHRTSMTTPHVAGLAALLWEAKPAATASAIENAIFNSCSRGAMPHDRANRGIPNAPRAYELLVGQPLPRAAAALKLPRKATARTRHTTRRRSGSKSKASKGKKRP